MDDTYLYARSIPEVVEAVDGLVARLGGTSASPLGRTLSREEILNAIAVYVLDQPPAEQARLLSEGLSRYEAMRRAADGNGREPEAAKDAEPGRRPRPFPLPDPPTLPTEQPAPFSLPLPGEWVRVEARPGRMPLPDPPED